MSRTPTFEPPDPSDLLADAPAPGQVVLVRSRRYLVEDVEPPQNGGDQTLVDLSCLDDDAQGLPLTVLWESEVDAAVLDAQAAWKHVARRGFEAPDVMSAYLDTLRWHCSTASDPKLFQAPFRAGIELMTYQLEPLRKALALPRVNLFIADDVGLGKTIEAGLILRELLLRQKVHNVVVACPPSVILQWRDELEQRFGLRFVIYDRAYELRQKRERGFGVSAWETHTRFLVSHALLRKESYAGPLRDWLKQSPGKSLLILDEAHNFAPSSSSRYALDSKQTRTIREIAPLFEHRLFLSATPHNGHSNSFSALLEILDPQRFCRGVPVAPRQRDEILVRRLKSDLRDDVRGIPERVVEQVDVDGLPDDAPELVLAQLLDEYRRLGEERLKDAPKRRRQKRDDDEPVLPAALAVSGLQKRLLSSIDAFARTLKVHRNTVDKKIRAAAKARSLPAPQKPPTKKQLAFLTATPNADDEGADLSEEELEAEVESQFELATLADPSVPSPAEVELLERMRDVAEKARDEPDGRVLHLVDWIREHMCPDLGKPGAEWNERRLLVFTEFVHTKNYLEEQLRAAILDSDDATHRIATYVGRGAMLGSQSHEEIRRAFNTRPDEHPLRILIANEAAREGINLQNYCYDLFHFDLPWNPSRIEQRNGRIDRKLQREPTVYCRYFVFTQRPEDRVLKALVKKTKTIRKELGSLSTVVEQRLANLLEDVVRRTDIDDLCSTIDGVETQLPATVRRQVQEELEEARKRDVKRNLEELRDIKEKSEEAAAFDEERFRHALSCSLKLLGSGALQKAPTPRGETQRYRFPALDKRIGADPTWAPTLDTLRAPRPRKLKPWEWRDTFPIRPVVFEDSGSLDADTVHLHLEHPVAQRLLHRFQARGFAEDELSRAAFLLTRKDAQRRIVLLGRLVLFGRRASRLHEEILAVTARWRDPDLRDRGLEPYASDTEAKTLRVLEEALTENARNPKDTRHLEKLVLPHVAADVADLVPYLEERAAQREAEVHELLVQRGEREGHDMEKILLAQRKNIEKEARRYDDGQLAFDFSAQEARQLKLNQQHWKKRLAELEEEILAEPKRIRTGYRVQVSSVEPVGIVYLWPASG